jgi:hypothetical protein
MLESLKKDKLECPKLLPNGAAGNWIKFSKPSDEWNLKHTKVWEFVQIQALVNLMVNEYGIVPLKIYNTQIQTERAIWASATCGFFQHCDCSKKKCIEPYL